MAEFIRDPELDRLVREMNRLADRSDPPGHGAVADPTAGQGLGQDEPFETGASRRRLELVSDGDPLERALRVLTRKGASDLILIPGVTPTLRVDGRLEATGLPALESGEVRSLLWPHMGIASRRSLERSGAADLSLLLPESGDLTESGPAVPLGHEPPRGGWRMRVNLHHQRGELAAVIRVLPQEVPSLARLNLPEGLADLVSTRRGLMLLCGPTGVGKTSTLAALVDRVNRTSERHVITIEDPIEYEHSNRRSIIEQVEIGSDAPSFAGALRAALRRAPDIILVGEMRDLETISTALTAAETGHLILATLHTRDVGQAIHRIIDVYPAEQQAQIRHQLALSLHAIVCQQLAARKDGLGLLPAVEVLCASYAVRNHIRKGEIHQLYNELLMGRGRGMIAMEGSLAKLVDRDQITVEEAVSRCNRPDELRRLIGRLET